MEEKEVKKQEEKQTNTKTKKDNKLWIIILLIVIIVSIAIFFVSKMVISSKKDIVESSKSDISNSDVDSSINDVDSTNDIYGENIFEDNFFDDNSYNIYDDYTEGEDVSFNAKITYIDEDGSYFMVDNLSKNNVDFPTAQVLIDKKDNQFKENSYIKVEGIKLIPKKTDLGIYSTMIKAKKIEKISYGDTTSSAVKTASIGQRKTQKGYTVIIDRVEFEEDQTRVFFTLENKGLHNFTIYEEYSVITQGGKQYKALNNPNGYTDSDGETYTSAHKALKPNAKSKDLLVFPAIEVKSFKIEVDGTSSKFGEDVELFKFDISI